jgi:hypothetical protein
VLAFTPHGPIQVARTLGRLAVHGLAGSRYVTRVRARQIELISDPPLPVELDGDVVTHTPVTLTVAPAALTVIAPLQKPWNRQRVTSTHRGKYRHAGPRHDERPTRSGTKDSVHGMPPLC